MHSLILASILLSAGAPPEELFTHVVRISPTDVAYVHVGTTGDGQTGHLFVLRYDSSSLLVEFDELRFVDGYVEAILYLTDNPTIFRTSYTDAQGDLHEIITNCGRYPANDSGAARCAEEHGRSIAAIKKLFPKELGRRENGVEFEQVESDRDIILPIRRAA